MKLSNADGAKQHDPQLAFEDSFPVPVCRFARAYRCQHLCGLATFGHDEMAKQTYYGLRAHVRVCYPGVIVALELTPANIADSAVVEDLTEQFTAIITINVTPAAHPPMTARLISYE